MLFFLPSENWEKSHRFYVVFYVGRRKTGLGLGFRVRVRVRV